MLLPVSQARTIFRRLGVEGRLSDLVDSHKEGLQHDVAAKALDVVRWREEVAARGRG